MTTQVLPDYFCVMNYKIDKIFVPGTSVDLVFNMNSLAPESSSSIVYDADFDHTRITIAQPIVPLSKQAIFKELHLTTIFKDEFKKTRVGIKCSHFKIIDHYLLANRETVPVIVLRYEPPAVETTIRSAFRLPLSRKYTIKGSILYHDIAYVTPIDFSIRDISLTGLGLVVFKRQKNPSTHLTDIKINDEISMKITLIETNQDLTLGEIPASAKIVRIDPDFSKTRTLMGLKLLSLSQENETMLNRFIHTAQVDELKRLSRRRL